MNAEVQRVMRLPEITRRMEVEGERAMPGTPEDFGAFVRAEVDKWGKLIREAGLKAE